MPNKVPATIKDAIRSKYAWPGGYPLYIVMTDGEALCVDCAKSEYKEIVHAIVNNFYDQWHADSAVINWEDNRLNCCNCNKQIEAAYTD